jgi:hypothetical protein
MVKFMIQFQRPANAGVFEDAYNAFLAAVERMPLVTRRQVVHVSGTPRGETSLHRILEVYFEDQFRLENALKSPEGQAAGGMLNRFPPGSVEMYFAEVFEEQGGHTPEGN